jgi:NAD(P)H-dependent FMN reductase
MITIISASGRQQNNTKKVALEYRRLLLEQKKEDICLLSLDEVKVSERDEALMEMENAFLIPAQKFIIIIPEYHGSYPGILKVMIDNTDVRKAWWHKKVLLVGVSTGRAGNLRGMEHLTGVLLHLKMLVHPNRLPISTVDKLLSEEGRFTDVNTLKSIQEQLEEFLRF